MNETHERCPWCGTDPIYVAYHDTEWGVPVHDGRALYEKLILDGFQAGLSWITILRKRNNFIAAFDGFDPEKIARYTEADHARLMQDAGIIRNRAKITGATKSAQAFLNMRDRGLDFSEFLWQFTDGKPIQNRWTKDSGIPAETKESQAMSKALKREGFTFCGPTITYAFMQAVGMVNDHLTSCPRHAQLGGHS